MADGGQDNETEAMLSRALQVRHDLQSSRKSEIKNLYDEFPEFWELIVLDLNGSGQGADPELAKTLGINSAHLNKFIKQKRPIPMRDARMVADRVVTYLRSIRPSNTPKTVRSDNSSQLQADSPRASPFLIRATTWQVVVRTDEVQQKINEAIRLIGEVIQHATETNLPADGRALTEVERAQLIAVLKTALKMLEAPMMETGLFKKAGSMLRRAAANALEKQVESAFAFAAGYAAGQLTSLASHF